MPIKPPGPIYAAVAVLWQCVGFASHTSIIQWNEELAESGGSGGWKQGLILGGRRLARLRTFEDFVTVVVSNRVSNGWIFLGTIGLE